jgi:pectate lyase
MKRAILCAALLLWSGSAWAQVPSFPGAEGFGAAATGGRGGRVLIVDSLADDVREPAPGTLRWACETQTGPRIVVFRTGGTIELARAVVVRNPDLTIAAQTAPGDGICLKGSALSIQANNVIVRGLRSRAGDGPVGTSGQYRRSLEILGPVSGVIVDHCTLGWGVDDDMNIYADKQGRGAKNLTIQWCLLTEGLQDSIHQQGPHSVAMTLGGGNIGPFSFHHNLLAHNGARNPRLVWGAEGEFVNNVIYNWGGQATIVEPFNPVKVRKDKRRPAEDEMRPARLNFIGNSWIAGPDSTGGRGEVLLKHATPGTAIYFRDNIGPHRPAGTAAGERESAVMSGPKTAAADKRALPLSSVTIQPSAEAEALVLAGAGAILPKPDAIDRRVVEEVRLRKGRIINSPADVGGYPDYARGTASADLDLDGMPDDWEKAHGLDPARANAAGRDLDPNYDNLEVYVNGLFRAP